MRAFVAAEISGEQVLSSIKRFQSEIDIRARPIALGNIHFTLLFLSEISEQTSARVQNMLNSIQFEEFNVQFQGIGAFPNASFPRTIWVGTDENGGERLKKLALQVENALSPLGFHGDKPFRPHMTIFRIKNKIRNISDKLKKFNTAKFGTQKISEIKFKKSILTPDGSIYSDLQVIKSK